MKVISFFKNPSENRTQFFIVMGFIVLPLLAMTYFFVELVMLNPVGSERIRIPQEIIDTPREP